MTPTTRRMPAPNGKSGIAIGALLMIVPPLVAHYEGVVPHTYADVNGVATLCAGETGPDIVPGMTATMDECLQRLDKRLAIEWGKAEPCIQRPITRNQAAAILSLSYNAGANAVCHSTLMRQLNAGQPPAVWCGQFPRWNQSRGVVLRGLVRRRAAEMELCLKP